MISEERTAIRPIVTNGETIKKLPDPTVWDWIKYYAFNLSRKPFVWQAKRHMKEIETQIARALDRDLYPRLIERARAGCSECAESYEVLRPQIFLSQVERVLKQMKCSSHHRIFENFYVIHQPKFRQSEDLAAWINGFKK